MKTVTLEIKDQVNCRLIGLDPGTKRVLREKNRYFQQWARHTQYFKAGYWDGYEYLLDIGGRTYINQLEYILPILIERGWEIDLKDYREDFNFNFLSPDKNMFSHIKWPDKHKHTGEPIVLMDHQVEALTNFLNNPQGVQCIPTGAGKTLLTAAMSFLCEPIGRTIIIVPSKSLVIQTEDDFKNLGLNVGVYFGDRKELNKKHTICTWQSLSILTKKSKKDEHEKSKLLELMKDVKIVICDECHNSKAKEMRNLLSGPLSHCPVRWGLTGTIPKEEFDGRIIINVIGNLIAEIKTKSLQDEGKLANCDIQILQLVDNYEFPDFYKENDYLCGDLSRLNWVANRISKISESGNALILVNRVKTGKNLQKMLEELGYESIFISGTMKVQDRKTHYKEIHDSKNKIVVATYGVASVGIDLPRIFNLVLFEPGKSFIRVIQSIGRGLRIASDKDSVMIYDITSTCKFSKRHLAARKKFYKEKSFPFTLNKINWSQDV